jgi:peptidoglycan/LPS O-acetylase OafA/YrhL
MPIQSTHIKALDGLRFVAALSVMFSHAVYQVRPIPDWSNVKTSTWFLTHTANFGMTLFFVLSGFVIHWNYRHSIQQPGGLKAFFVARVARLYPLFFVMFIVGATGEIFARGHFERVMLTTPFYLTFISSWWYWQVDGVHIYEVYADPAIGVLWSLATEAFFYAIYPLLAAFAARLSLRASMIAIGATGMLAAVTTLCFFFFSPDIGGFAAKHFETNYSGFLFWLGYNSPWMRLSEFLTGVFAAQLVVSGFRLRSLSADVIGVFCLAAIAAGIVIIFLMKNSLSMNDTTLLAPMFGGVCIAAASGQSMVGRFLSAPAMVWGGEASYSLYLLHAPILVFFTKHGLLNPAAPVGGMLLASTVIILTSRVSYVWIERPAQKLLRRHQSKALVIAARPNA